MKKIAALTMVHEDYFVFEKWVNYYGGQLGLENLYVIMHGFDDRIEDIARGCNIIPAPRSGFPPRFDLIKMDLFNVYNIILHEVYDVVITVDTDELLAVDPAIAPSLIEFFKSAKPPYAAVNGFSIELRPMHEFSAPLKCDQNIMAQRRYAVNFFSYNKPVASFAPVEYGAGQHGTTEVPVNFMEGLLLVSVRFADFESAVKDYTLRAGFAGVHDHSGLAGEIGMSNVWRKGAKGLENDMSKLTEWEVVDYDDGTFVPSLIKYYEKKQRLISRKKRGHHYYCAPNTKPRFRKVMKLPERFKAII